MGKQQREWSNSLFIVNCNVYSRKTFFHVQTEVSKVCLMISQNLSFLCNTQNSKGDDSSEESNSQG